MSRRRMLAALLAAAAWIPGSTHADMAKKRAAPAPVPPVAGDGVRYEAIHWGKARGLGQNGGLVAVIDEATGQELRVLRVYPIEYDPDLEPDKQDIFITSLDLSPGGGCLGVEDEQGRWFTVELATGEVWED